MKRLLLFLLLFVLIGCKKNDFNSDFPYMKDTVHRYQKVDFEEAYSILTSKTGIIVFAFNSNLHDCPYCKVVLPLLNEVLVDEVDVIYYLDIYEMRQKQTKEYLQLLEYLDSRVELLEKEGIKTIIVPDVYFVRDGVILDHHIATLKDESNTFVYSLSEEQKDTLKGIYRHLLTAWKHV